MMLVEFFTITVKLHDWTSTQGMLLFTSVNHLMVQEEFNYKPKRIFRRQIRIPLAPSDGLQM
jgi:hypothetical protein